MTHSIALLQLPLALAPSPEGGGGSPFMGLLPLVMVVAIFYLLILRPQQKRQKEHKNMVESLGKGDRILTTGGLYATITDVKDEYFVATIAEGVKVEVARTAVAARSEKNKKGKKSS